MSYDNSSFTARTTEIVTWLEKEFATIRTGQATPTLLDAIRVDSYGAKVPLNQVANVGIEDARTLRISPWDRGSINGIETAIQDADLGLSVQSDDTGVRVIFPELTGERRQELAKLAKKKLEDARVSLRAARDETMKAIDAAEKAGELSEDEKFRVKDDIQSIVDATNEKLEQLYKAKESSITTV